VILGVWQMLMRSPLPAPFDDSNNYYASVTLHGTAMAYVVTTFFVMGFGYAVTATSLGRPVRGITAAWIGFAICLIGTLMAVAAVLSGRSSVLYTFYPPLLHRLHRGPLDDPGRQFRDHAALLAPAVEVRVLRPGDGARLFIQGAHPRSPTGEG